MEEETLAPENPDNLISLNPEQEQVALLSLDTPGGALVPPVEVAEQRAVKADLGMGERSPGREALVNGILNGTEDFYRQQAATNRDLQEREMKLEIIRGLTSAKKAPLSLEEQDMILSLSQERAQNFKTIFEEDYGRAFVQKAAEVASPDSPVNKVRATKPDEVNDEEVIASHAIAKKEIAQRFVEDLETEAKDQSWGSFGLDLLAGFLPGYSWYQRQNAVKRAPTTSFLPGNNVEEQIAYLYTLPNDDMQRELGEALRDMKSKNLTEARNFARDVLAYGTSDKYLENLFGVADLLTPVDILGIGLQARKAAKLVDTGSQVRQAVKGVVEGAAGKKLEVEEALAATGNIQEAARVGASKALMNLKEGDPTGDASFLMKGLNSLLHPERFWGSPSSLGRERTDRLVEASYSRAEAALNAVTSLGKVDRLPEEALQQAFKEAEANLRTDYRGLNDGILDVQYNHPTQSNANVGSVSMYIGQKDGTLFDTPQIAAHHAQEVYKIPGARIGQRGNGFYIRVDKDIDETTDTVRNLVIQTENQNPTGFFNHLLGKFRTPDEVLSPFQVQNRKAATFGTQELHRVVKDLAEPITSLGKKARQNVETILRDDRDFVDKATGRRGREHGTLTSFETAYRARFGKNPTEMESSAYFSFIQLMDLDYMIRNMGLYRDKARLGIERTRYKFLLDGKTTATQGFEAKKVSDIPPAGASEDAGILIHEHDGQPPRFVRLREMTQADRDYIQELKDTKGYEILQVANPLEKPLASWAQTRETVNFVVATGVERRKLDWKQFERRPGSHVEYDYGFWVKQPKMSRVGEGTGTRHIYEGDTTIHPFHTEAEARKYSERYETARKMMLAGDKGLDDYVQKHLGMREAKFKELFEPRERQLPNGETVLDDPFLRPEDPIVFVREGRASIDDYHWQNKYQNFEDNIRSQYNLYNQIDKKFAGERDQIVKTIHERPDGALEHVPAKNIDPFTTLNRATTNIMRSRMLADYKISAIEQWVAQYGHLMDANAVPQDLLKANPVHYLHNPVWDSRASDQALLASAKQSRDAILNLLGSDTQTGQAVEALKERILSDIYKRMGQDTSDWVSESKIWQSRDPLKTARAIAFHTKLGLFAWPQFFTQLSTVAHATALAPRQAIPGVAAGTFMRWLALNARPETVEHYAKLATKFGWTREHFKESYAEMLRTGLFNVEGEHAWRNDMFDPQVVQSGTSKFLDWGTTFFREGERTARLSAWNMAYREWREANPKAVLNNQARNSILNRMDTMMVNMTRASNAAWQNGIMSVPTQFMGYQIRMMEQMTGSRLTVPEKARLFGMYSFLYGVPTAAGASIGVNVYDHLRQKAIEHGYNGENLATRALMEGATDVMWKVITGQDYNVSEKYGPNGINLRDLQEKTWMELMLGASGSILGDIGQSFDPAWKHLTSIFDEKDQFKMTGEDVIGAFRNISSVNSSVKLLWALNTGKYVSQGEVHLSDVTPGTAIFSAITGMQPQELEDLSLYSAILKGSKEAKDEAQKQVTANVRRAIREYSEGNSAAGDTYLRNARVFLKAGGFRPDEYGKVMSQATAGQEDLVSRMRHRFIMNAPEGEMLNRIKQMQKN